MNKLEKALLEENNCLSKFKEVQYQAKRKGLRLGIEKDYSGEYTSWEFFSITLYNTFREPEEWVKNDCLYDGLEEMEEIVKNL